MIFRRLGWVIVITLLAGIAHAQTTSAQQMLQLREQVSASLLGALQSGQANPFPQGTYAADLHAKTMSRIVRETTFVDFLISKIDTLPQGAPPREYGMAVAEELVADGLRRIPDDLLIKYMGAEARLLVAASPVECAAIARQSISTAQKRALMQRLDDAVLADYYVVTEAAIRAALGNSSLRSLTPTQEKVVTEYVGNYMRQRMTEAEIESAVQLSDPRTAAAVPDRLACKTSAVMMAALLEAKGDMRRWIARWVVNL